MCSRSRSPSRVRTPAASCLCADATRSSVQRENDEAFSTAYAWWGDFRGVLLTLGVDCLSVGDLLQQPLMRGLTAEAVVWAVVVVVAPHS